MRTRKDKQGVTILAANYLPLCSFSKDIGTHHNFTKKKQEKKVASTRKVLFDGGGGGSICHVTAGDGSRIFSNHRCHISCLLYDVDSFKNSNKHRG